ncbi:MAG: formylmethanofuran dehydrogenase subunit C [Pirellulales bacterium]
MPLRLTYFGDTQIPVEVEGLTPDWACDKSPAEIERFEIFEGNRRRPLAEMFRVSGSAADSRIEWEGNLAGVHWIGAGMQTGVMHVAGSVGRHVGSGLRGGSIYVDGDAGDWAGAELHGGLLHVRGNAAQMVGAAYRGSPKGMTGGTILVDGDAGDEVGATMRRGLIAVGGSAGDLVGFNMIAGTVLVFGDCGIRAGANMRRGTIGLLGTTRPTLLPTFRFATTIRPHVACILFRSIAKLGLPFDEALLDTEFEVYRGDLVSIGRGELWLRSAELKSSTAAGRSTESAV